MYVVVYKHVTQLYVLVMGLVLGQSLMDIPTMGILLYAKYLPFIMYYGSALLLFTRKVHCLQTFWQVIAHRVIGPYLGTKFHTWHLLRFLRYWDSN